MRENMDPAVEENAAEQVRRAVRNMRRFKRVNRLCGGVRVFVSEDVFERLKGCGAMQSDPCGNWSMDCSPVKVVHGYPRGYISAE